jgi:hypothetical protein
VWVSVQDSTASRRSAAASCSRNVPVVIIG